MASLLCSSFNFASCNPSKRCIDFGKLSVKKRKCVNDGPCILAMAPTAPNCQIENFKPNYNLQMMKIARKRFCQEISFRSKDRDVSLIKALLLIAAEDEAYMAYNHNMDAQSIISERKDSSIQYESGIEFNSVEEIPLAGKTISGWLNELKNIAKEVEVELVDKDIGCHLVEVLEAVNVVLFESRGFKRFPVLIDSKFSYLHTVLSSGHGSAVMISIIYMEICHRLGVNIVGARVGEDFLIWPHTENLEELFKAYSGHSWLAKRLHWKRASKSNRGLMLTSPLRPVHNEVSRAPLLRPQELRLAVMASERLLILQPLNWSLRRDHGMLLYYNKKYAEAVQELSICMAFAPVEEANVLEPFIEKLHLLRVESSWKSLDQAGSLAVP